MSFNKVVENIIQRRNAYFVLETLEVLRRNGRLSRVTATLASALNIKPVMEGTREGVIQKLTQARGTKKALMKMVEAIAKEGHDLSRRTLAIAHCNCPKRAEYLKGLFEQQLDIGEIIITETRGVSSLYACDGGIVVSY
jgi:DegV family protein with EDD domain